MTACVELGVERGSWRRKGTRSWEGKDPKGVSRWPCRGELVCGAGVSARSVR